jgi:hypothetical protein
MAEDAPRIENKTTNTIESQEGYVYDAEEFLNEFFDYARTLGLVSPNTWNWSYSPADKVVNLSTRRDLSQRFNTQKVEGFVESSLSFPDVERGSDKLFNLLRGKKVKVIIGDDGTNFLQIVNDTPNENQEVDFEEAPEKPETQNLDSKEESSVESQEGYVYDAEKFVSDFFIYTRDQGLNSPSNWRWKYDPTNKVVDLYTDRNLSERFNTQKVEDFASSLSFSDFKKGSDELFNLLRGKKVKVIQGDEDSFLQIVDDKIDGNKEETSEKDKSNQQVNLEEGTTNKPDKQNYLKHFEAKRAKAERFKESHQFQALMKLIKSDPDLHEEYESVVARRDEFKNIQKEGEKHRDYTGMLSAIMLSPRLRALLEPVFENSTQEYSDQIKSRIENGQENYIEEVVIGSGVYGQILASTRQMYFPENPALTIEASHHTGGQFAEYGGDAFQLNSRTRPEKRDMPYLPGTEQTLNTFEEHAVIQPSDIESLSYPYQSTVADTARMNFFVTGRAIVDAELQKVRKNNEGGLGKYILEVYDKDTEKIIEVKTDRIYFSSGLGEEKAQLQDDFTTQSILRKSKALLEAGQDAPVMSFKELSKHLANPENPFPLRNMKTVAVSGSGDSSLVAIGTLLGYERRLSKTAMQIDRVETIYWIGASYPTKEEFLQNVRARYARVGLELPRSEIEEYYARIKPVVDTRATTLREADEPNMVRVEDSNGNSYLVDHYIYAHGFEDRTDAVIAGLSAQVIESEYLSSLSDQKIFTTGNQFFYSEGSPYKSVEILDSQRDSRGYLLQLKCIDSEGRVTVKRLSSSDREIDSLITKNNIVRGEFIRNERFEFEEVPSEKDPEIPIASKFRNEEVYKIGVAAKLTPTEKERNQSAALRKIPENSASIFLYASKAREIAEINAKKDIDSKKKIRSKLLRFEKPKQQTLEALKESNTRISTKQYSLPLESLRKLPIEGNTGDMIRFAITESLTRYKFPLNLDKLTIRVERSSEDDEKTKVSFNVDVQEKIRQKGYEKMISDVFENDLVLSVCEKITRSKNNKTKTIELLVPFYGGSVLSGGIGYRTNV